jgi:AcrR family transcriptional regulator
VARLKRSESQARTRERLLQAASDLFRRDGYAITSLERIAEAAGFTKGAVYSNFDSKEAIYLEVLSAEAIGNLGQLLADLDGAADLPDVVDMVAQWARERSRHGGWSLSVMELARTQPAGAPCLERLEEIVRRGWRGLGGYLRQRFPGGAAEPEVLGALLFEIAYAPALTFLSTPDAADLVRLVLPAQLAPRLHRLHRL